MSHYTVGVILDGKEIDQEINSAIKKMKEIEGKDATEEEILEAKFLGIQYLTEKALQPFYEGLKVESYVDMTTDEVKKEHEAIKNYTEEEMEENSHKKYLYDKYKDEDLHAFAQGYYGSELTDEGIMSNYNPNSKWDWYVIGGRWACSLPTANNKETPDEVDTYSDNINSFAKIKDIIFTKDITEEERDDLENRYEKMITKGDFYKPEYYQRKYPTLDDFIKEWASFNTYALLTSDGKWHEPGRMGWFGVSTAEPEEEVDFKSNYSELILKENPENYFVLVDCHI